MDDNYIIKSAQEAFEQGRMEEALSILKVEALNNDITALYMKGEASYNLQRWGEALNYFRIVVENNPGDIKAKTYVQMINNILSF